MQGWIDIEERGFEEMEYMKINSLWKREGWYFDEKDRKNPTRQKGRQSFIVGDYALDEFGLIKKWRVEEKIDGTNIRIIYKLDENGEPIIRFMGRTSRASIPTHLLSELMDIFTFEKMKEVFGDASQNELILFGEGCGPKIQKGGENYSSKPQFILFEAFVNNWWLLRESIVEIAGKLGITFAPHIGFMTEDEVVEYVKSKPLSLCSVKEQVMEGVICRTYPQLLLRNRIPLMFKLKCIEFE